MARIQTFDRDLRLATADIAPAAIAKELAAFARASLSEAIANGEGSPVYDKYVNGRFGAAEESVVAPGPIVYDFIWWGEILPWVIQFLVERSPDKSGRYKRSWVVLADGAPITSARDIGLNATVWVTNTQPYSRKIDVGFMEMSVQPGLIEDARRRVMATWGNAITARGTMVQLPSGPAPAPYRLKGVFKRGIRPQSRTKLRSDTRAGAMMTYPTLELKVRV